MALHKNVFLCVNLHGPLRLDGMQVHGAVENVWFGICQSMQFALNIFDHVVIVCLNFKLQIPIRVAAIGSADISLHVLETCTPDSILKVRSLCVYRRPAG